jgi:hypothetical protein
MIRPSDQIPGGDDSPEASGEQESVIRKVGMIDPGFREELETSVLRPRILGIKPPAHPKDRRNMKFLLIAIAVAVVIFGILEYKQIRDAANPDGNSTESSRLEKR